jgi:hypothetical protein
MKSLVIALLLLCWTAAVAHAERISNNLGWKIDVNQTSGAYRIDSKAPDWTVGGSVGVPLADVASVEGQDKLGAFREITFGWKQEGQRHGSIRLYRTRPCVLFCVTFDEAVSGSPAPFPVLDKLPKQLMEFRFGDQEHLRPPTFSLAPGKNESDQYGGPFALFDSDANSMIFSPADNFMVAMVSGDQKAGLRSGFNRTLQSVPAGYSHETLLTIDRGINHTWDVWGEALTDLHGKHRPANDADAGLKYLGYWTDNGAYYYYNYDLDKGYEGTLLALKDHFAHEHIPVRYMQLDSWWYPKTFNSIQPEARDKKRSKNPQIPEGTWNRYGGMLEYTAHPDLFPDGLGEFHKKLSMPLVTHSRWVDPESPYRQSYKVSGVAAVDPAWWNHIIGNIADSGVATYEQDWLNHIYLQSPELFSTTWAGDAFMDGMAAACKSRGVTMQYCMVLARHVMQGAKYSNLTTVRVSGDRLNRGKWREFVYGSRLASALGIWPWTDVFKSSETPNLLISTLSGGMVGLSDRLGEEQADNIFRAVRRDGVIIKPDVPLLPTDATFIAEARGNASTLVCTTRTEHDASSAGKAVYVFAFQPKSSDDPQKGQWTVQPRDAGIDGACFAYDYFSARGEFIDAGKALPGKIDGEGWNYQVLCPVGPSGMALIGDVGAFVTRGRKRIAAIDDQASALRATVLFSKDEQALTIAAYAPTKPTVVVQGGECKEVSYDSTTRIALARIAVDAAASAVVIDGDPVKQVEVTFHPGTKQ